MDAEIRENPRGLFDRTARGYSTPPVAVSIERGRVRFFSETLGETNPIYLEVEAARAAGHPDVVAPPSYFMVIEAEANAELTRLKQGLDKRLQCDFRYLLHGDERYHYRAPIYAGDQVLVTSRVIDFYDKKGGAMEFVTIESVVTHPERGELVRTARTLLHRLPA